MSDNFFADFAPARRTVNPLVVPPDPRRVAEDEREAARQAAADARAQEAAARADRADARAERADARAATTAAAKPAFKPTEYQSKSAGFLGRMIRANEAYAAVPDGERDPRTVPGQWLADNLPGVDNSLNSSGRQVSDQAARDFIAATLRQESGAAISAEEFRNQYRIYFPQPGDSEEALAQKALARKQAIEGFRVAAGPLAAEIPNVGIETDTRTKDEKFRDEFAEYDDADGLSDPNARVTYEGKSEDLLTPEQKAEIAARTQGTDSVGAAATGLADTVTLGFLDEAGSALEASFGEGEGSWSDRYNARLRVNRGVRDGIRDDHKIAYTGGQIGGAFLPMGAARLAQLPGRLGTAGAITGGAYGFGSADGSVADRLIGAAGGAAIGGASGAIFQRAAPYLGQLVANRAARRAQPTVGQETMAAADRLDIPALPADVGGPVSRLLTAGGAQSIMAAPQITRAAENVVEATAAARGRIAAGEGRVLAPDDAGAVVRDAGQRLITETSARGGRFYSRAERLSQGVRIKPVEAVPLLDQQIAEAASAGPVGAPVARVLTEIRDSLAQPGGITPTTMRSIRTSVAQSIRDNNLRGTNTQRVINEALDAAGRDMERGLMAAGRTQAAATYRRADAFWRQRIEHIDEVLEPVIGQGKSGEDILGHLAAMTTGGRGGIQRLRGVLNGMSDAEVGNIRATLIDRLGRAKKDNGEIDNFSPARFVTQWGEMSTKAKAALFGNSELRRSLDDLATVARGSARADRYRNSSNTGGAMMNMGSAAGAGAGIATGGVGMLPLIGGAVLVHATGRLMASPGFARIVAGAPRNASPQAVRATMARLERLATRTPALAADIAGVQRGLIEQLSNHAGRAVAEGQQDPRNP